VSIIRDTIGSAFETTGMMLQDAFALFRRLGVYPEVMSRAEFSAAYFRLAQRFHPDVNPAALDLMTNINAARTAILQSYRRST
jgi:curved DNA-binding protein CbpA